MMWCGN